MVMFQKLPEKFYGIGIFLNFGAFEQIEKI